MKREGLILNVVCVLLALLFIGLIVMNFFESGDFLTTDSLFFTVVFLTLALLLLVNPIFTLLPSLPVPQRFRRTPEAKAVAGATTTSAQAALPPMRAHPIIRDAKGRPVPADVRNILIRMREPEEQKALREG